MKIKNKILIVNIPDYSNLLFEFDPDGMIIYNRGVYSKKAKDSIVFIYY